MRAITSSTRSWRSALLWAAVLVVGSCSLDKVGLGSKIDIVPPRVSITSPSNGQYLSGTIHMVGTAVADVKLTSLVVSYPTSSGQKTQNVTVSGKAWTCDIPSGVAGGISEGKVNISATGTDDSGKVTTNSVLVYVDNKPPTVLVTSPSSYSTASPPTPPTYSDYVDITGEAWDPSPVAQVNVTLTYKGLTDNQIHTVTKLANGTNAWSVRFLLKSGGTGGFNLALSDDTTILWYSVAATDAAGNTNTYFYHAQDIYTIIDQVTGTLFPTTYDIGQIDQGIATSSSSSNITNGNLTPVRISNTATTANIGFTYNSTVAIVFSNLDVSTPGANILAPGSVIVGSIIPPPTAGALLPNTLVFKIYAATSYPTTYLVQLTPASPLGSQLTLTPVGNSENFRVALADSSGVNLPSGNYVVEISAQANNTNPLTTHLAFSIDSSAPTLTEATVGNALALESAPFSMAGTAAAGGTGLGSLEVRESANGGPYTQAYLKTYTPGTTTDNWTTPTLPLTVADGSYSYKLTLTSQTGLPTILYRSVIYDATPPTVGVTSPTAGTWTSGSTLALSGTSGDGSGSGVNKVYYLVDSASVDHSADIATWNTTNGSSAPVSGTSASWQSAGGLVSAWTGSASMATEGGERLWVVAADNVGNTDKLALTNAGSFVTGKTYTIETLGSTDFTSVGATSNTVGLSFTATGGGSGSGKAWTGTGQLIPFGRDVSPPTLTVAAVPAVINAANAASLTAITGTAFDTNTMAFPQVTVQYTKNGVSQGTVTAPYSPPATSYASGNPWSWPFPVDASGHTTDGSYVFTVTATDAAGKTTSQSVSTNIDTRPPTTTVTQPGNYLPSNSLYWLSGPTASLTGTATDAGGTSFNQVASVYFKVDTKGVNHASDDPTTWTLAAGTSNWSATLDLTALGEGAFTLWVAALDTAGNVSSLQQRDFGVDQAPPTVTATSVPSYTKAAFTVSGSVGDSNALASLTVTETKNGTGNGTVGTTTTPASITGAKSATYTTVSLPKGGVVDGSYAYSFTATDAAGKTTVINRTVVVDTVNPTVALNAIPAWLTSSAVTISGTATDPGAGASGVASVQYQLDGGTWTAANWVDGSGGANTSGSWNTTLTSLTEGSHTVSVKATDAAGNVCAVVNGSFGVDLAPPSLTANAPSSTITAANAASFTALTGTLSDTNPASLYGSTLTLAMTSTQNGATVASASPVTAAASWTTPFTVDTSGHTTDGLWSFAFTASDAAGRTTTVSKAVTIDTKPPVTTVTAPSSSGWVSGSTLSVTGVANDGTGTGVAAVWVRVDGLYVASTSTDHSTETPSAGAGWTLASGQTNFSASLTLSGEGRKTLWVKAFDAAGNLTSASGAVLDRVDFGLDLNPPTLSFNDSVGTLVNTGFTLSGTTADTNPAGSPALAVAVDGGSAQAVTVTAGAWTFPVSSLPADGSHTWVFTSTDVAGKTTSLSRTITVDTTAPTVSVSNPGSYTAAQSQYWLSGSTAAFGGSASDPGSQPSGVARVYYLVDTLGVNHSADVPSTWTQAAGSSNWSATVTLASEGQFTLWVATYDNAGNVSSLTQRAFGVDQSPPSLSETNHAPTSSTRAAYTLAGAVGDTNALASLAVTESKNGGAANTVSFSSTPGSLSGVKTATWNSASLPLGGVSDGSYVYVLTATDAAGKTTTVNRTVNIDTTPPTVSLNPLPAWTGSTALPVSGSAADPNTGASGVATVEIQLDGGSWTAATWLDSSGGANTTGTWNTTLTGLAEGNHSLAVRSTDAAGNTTTLGSSSFGVDLNPPNLAAAAPPSLISSLTAGAFTTISGTVYDTNPVAPATLTVTSTQNGTVVANATAVPYPGTSTSAGNAWSYTPFASGIDVAGHADDGLWTFVFTATDAAGRTTSVTKTLSIDTQPPTTTVTAPSAGWVSSSTLPVTGVTSDGTGTGVSKVYVKTDALYVASSATDHSAEDPTDAANGWTLASGQTSWSASLTLSGEGRKTLWVKAIDAAGNITTAAGAVFGRVDFGLDLTPPSLASTDAVGSLVRAGFTLTGTTSDTNPAGNPSLSVTVDGGASQAVTVTAGAWSFPVTVLPADGPHTYFFMSTDVAGKTTTLSRTITIDTTVPTLTIANPASYTAAQAAYWLSGATASIAGSAADAGTGASGVASIYYKVDTLGNSHAADTPSTWTLAAGTTNWSATLNLATLGEGQFTLWTAAYDTAGNVSAISQRNFGVDQAPPTLSETNHPAISSTKSAYTMAGAVGDTNALASLTITESKNGGAASAVTVNSTPATLTGVTAATYVTPSLPLGGVADGSYVYVLTGTDAAGKTTTVNRTVNIDTTAPTVGLTALAAWVTSTAYTIGGTGTDPNSGASGVASVQYNLDSSGWVTANWVDTSGGANTTGTWNATLTGLTEGNHSLTVRATDAAGNTTTLAPSNFGVDLAPPSLTETLLGTTAQVIKNGSFTLTGSVSDSNPGSVAGTSLTVSVSINGGASQPATVTGTTWTYNQAKVDGSYSYVITATDVAGRTASVNRLVLLDSTPPSLAVTAPSVSQWMSTGTLLPSGTALDGSGSGVRNTYYLVDVSTNDHSGDIATWNATAGTAPPVSGTSATWATASTVLNNWSGSSALAGEGTKILWVVSSDKAGNTTPLAKVNAGSFVNGTVYTIGSIGTTDFTAVGASSNTVGLSFTATGSGSGSGYVWSGTGTAVPFGYDTSAPALTETGVNTTSTVVENAAVVFSGSASDSDALAASHSLTVSVDGAAASDVSFTSAPAWSYTYNVDTSGHTQDGTHSLVFTATDIAGKTSTVTRSVLVDTTPAAITVTSPVASSWTNASTYTVAGTATDAGAGVSQVWVLVDAAAVNHAADTSSVITAGTTWKQATGTTNWNKAWTMSGEGPKTLWVAVLDTAGNWSTTYSTVNFGFDTTAPSLALNALGGFNAPFSITGTVSDSASGVSALLLKIDSGSFTSVTVAPSWTSAVTGAAFTALSEGTHTVTILSTDSAGNQTTQTGSFNKDTTPPTVSYNNISSGGGTVDQDTNPVLTGTLSDVSGVASATYTLKVWNAGTSSWNVIANAASLGSPAGATNWPWSIDLSSAGLNLPDGSYQVSIGATDSPGNAIASPTVVGFLLSRTSPAPVIVSPALGTFQSAAFPLVGTASDPNGVTLVRAKLASGSVNFSSGATNALPALPVSVTTGSPGTFTTLSAHGFSNGTVVYLWGTPMPVTPSGSLAAGTAYYVTNATATTFNLAATSGGAALAINTSTATNLIVAASGSTFASFRPTLPVSVNTGNPGTVSTTLAHGLSTGDVVYLSGTALPSPATAATAYYVVNPTGTTFQLATTSGGSAIALTTSGTAVSVYSPTHPVNWLIPSMPVTGNSDGPLTAYVQVAAGSGKTNQTSRDFTLDTTAPTITVSSPTSATRSVGNLTITGTSNDGGSVPSGVVGSIQYQIGNGYNLTNASSWTSANVTGGAYSWSISLGDMSAYANATYATQCDSLGNPASGTNLWKLPIVFQATDKAGNLGQLTSYFLILDPNGNIPVVNITQPATGLTFGGQQRITGTASQPVGVFSVQVAIDPAGGTNFPANPVAVTISGSTLTAASNPLTDGMMVFLSGTAAPQIGGSNVVATTAYWVVNATGTTFQVAANSGGTPLSFSSAGSGVTASPWATATLTSTGNNVSWYYDVNTSQAYPQNGAASQRVTVQARAWNAVTLGGAQGTITGLLTTPLTMTFNSTFPQIQNVTVNSASYFSGITSRGSLQVSGTVKSSKGLSQLSVVESSPLSGGNTIYNIANSYASGSGSNGSYWSATVTPPSQQTSDTFSSGNTKQVMITVTGSNSSIWAAAGAPASVPGTVFTPNNTSLNVGATGGSFMESDTSGNFNYTVSMTMNSTALYNNTTGVYAFYFQMTDMTSPTPQVSTSMVTINVDNYYPTSTQVTPALVTAGGFQLGTRYAIVSVGTTDFTAVGAGSNTPGLTFVATGSGSGTGTAVATLQGTQYKIQGSATDVGTGSGTIGGLNKVVVYLTNSAGTQILDMKSGGASVAASSITAMDMANSGTIGSVAYPNTASYSNYFASIDTIAENGLSDYNGDGFLESFITNGNARDWWVQIDTTKLADGPVVVHYVVLDQAGNATHYSQAAFVSNNAPVLTSIDLGTDLNGDGSISAGEITNFTSYSATNFTVRNSRLYFKVNYTKGTNTPLNYSVKYNSIERNSPTTNSPIIITDFSTIPDSSAANDRAFTITVSDNTGQSFVQTVNLTIHNTDTIAPSFDLAPFGKRYSTPLDAANGSVNTDTGKTLGNVTAYTDNVGGSLGALTGHVEYALDSTYNPQALTLATPGTGSFTNTGTNGLSKNSIVYFSWTTPPTTAPAGTGPYYVIGTPTATAFQVSTTKGGSAAVFSGTGVGIKLATPDLSGKVIFRGRLYDDQKISTVTVTIPGYNSGSPVTLANWSSSANSGAGGLVPVTTDPNWTFTVDSGTESVSQADGYVSNWAFTFDTSKIATVAAANISALFTASDGTNTTTTAMNFDVVPYITDFSRQTPFTNRLSSNTMNVNADGYYPIYQGTSGYTITGFNLYYSSASAQVGSTALTVSSPTTTSLSVTTPASLTTTVGNANAQLKVTTNGIDSINNTNGFSAYNSTNSNGALYTSFLTTEGTSLATGNSFTDDVLIYVDDQAPTIAVADFGTKYPVQSTDDATNGIKTATAAAYTDNVPYSGSTSTRSADGATTAAWLGHVEYKADNVITAGRAVVSGVVTFKGKASDNERIAKITATIPGFDGGNGVGAEFEIYNLANGFEYYNGFGFVSTGTSYTASGSASTLLGTKNWTAWADGTDYKVTDSTRIALGHVLNWNFSWDSSAITTVAATGVTVTFKAYDANNTPQTSTSALTVDVAPYITSVVTSLDTLSPSNTSVFNRTALGKYPVREGETITVKGFNLYKSAATTATTNTVSATINTGTATTTSVAVTMPTPAGAISTSPSGNFVLTVNGVNSINNSNSNASTGPNARPWNLLPNGVNNNNLTDDVVMDVWRFNSSAAVPISGRIASPVMKISPTSDKIGFAFTNGPLYYSMPGTFAAGANPGSAAGEYSYIYSIASYDFLTSVAMTYDSSGHTYATAAGGDINSSSADKYVLLTDRWGVSQLNNNGTYGGTNALRLESIGLNNAGTYDFDKYRIQTPSLVTSRISSGATSTNLYLAYYDEMQNEIAFRYGNLPDTTTTKANFTASTAQPLVKAGSLVTNSYYTITSLGTTDFTLIGAKSNTVGMYFRATGAGTGTGTAVLNTNAGGAVDNRNALVVGTAYVLTTVGAGNTWANVGATGNTANVGFIATGTNAGGTSGSATRASFTAGSFTTGTSYTIINVGTTDFTLIGAASNTVGLTFTATGAGTGTGTAMQNTSAVVTTGSFVAGTAYQIQKVGDVDYTAIGAASNTVGAIFTATGTGPQPNFYDSDTAGTPPVYTNAYKQVVAGSTTGRNAGEYVSIGVVPGASVSSDVVVMVWYDSVNQQLLYSYNTSPTTNRAGTATAAGWSSPRTIFSNAGQYCQIAVDAGGGIHIAAYDNQNGALLYAHLTSYSDTSPLSCVVDSYGIVGTNITLDVAQSGSQYIPYIGYYAQSSIKPKYAYLVDTTTAPNGAVNDYFTGKWESTLVPSPSNSPQDNINVGVWKTSAGALKNSAYTASSYTKSGTGYGASNYGAVFGNGTSNGVLGYQIKVSTNGYIETAQKD